MLPACSGSKIVQPLNKSQWQASASFGGPLISSNSNTEITPLGSLSAAYGFKQNITGFASWHWGSYLEKVDQYDVGYTQELLQPFSIIPGITYTAQANLFFKSGFENFKFYPQLDINAYWILPNKDFVYTGMSNWFELSQKKAHNQTQEHHWLPGLHAGYSKYLGIYSANLEMKYLMPLQKDESKLINFINLNNRGALALFFSVSRSFK